MSKHDLKNVERIENVQNKKGSFATRALGAVGLGVLTISQANAALELDPAAFAADIATAETFTIAIGLLFLAFIAVGSLLKKSRGSVK